MTRMVSSPAMVPTIVGQRGAVEGAGQVVGGARRGAQHGEVAAGVGGDEQLAEQSRQPVGAAGAPRATGLPSSGTTYTPAPPSAARSFTAPSSSRSRDSVAWVASMPSSAEQRREFGLAAHRCAASELDDAGLPSGRESARCSRLLCGSLLEQPHQQRLLRVQAVLRLVPDHALRAVEHLVGDLLAAVRGQAVQHDRVGVGACQQRRR